MVVVHIEGLPQLHARVQGRVDLGEQHQELGGGVEPRRRVVVRVVRAHRRPYDQGPEQPHLHLLLRVGTALVEERAGDVRHELIRDAAGVSGGGVGERRQRRAAELRLRRGAVGEHVRLPGEHDRGGFRETVVQHHRHGVALVHAQDRPWVLERVAAEREPPHVRRHAVGQGDVPGPGVQRERGRRSGLRRANQARPCASSRRRLPAGPIEAAIAINVIETSRATPAPAFFLVIRGIAVPLLVSDELMAAPRRCSRSGIAGRAACPRRTRGSRWPGRRTLRRPGCWSACTRGCRGGRCRSPRPSSGAR